MITFRHIVTVLGDGLAILASLCLAAAILIISWMILWRWLGHTNHWELETSIYLTVAAVFLASPYTLRTGGHIGMELLDVAATGRLRHWLKLVADVVGLSMCLFLMVYGGELAWNAFVTNERELGMFAPPLWPKYVTIPIGMGLTAAQYLCGLAATTAQLRTPADV